MAEISGGNFGEGMTTAAINKLVIVKLGEMTYHLRLTDQKQH
jgi:hypothetical protein